MVKKNTNFRLGLNRQQLKEMAMYFGKTEQQVKKANTKVLENFVAKKFTLDDVEARNIIIEKPGINVTNLKENIQKIKTSQVPTRRKQSRDTNFQFGIDRTELKKLAVDLGYKGKVGKTNTKALERFITNQLVGRGKNVELTEPMKKDIKAMFDNGYSRGKSYLAEKLARVTGIEYEGDLRLKLEIEKQFSVFYDGVITKEMVDELLYKRMQYTNNSNVWNGMRNTFEYADTFEEYARELTEKEGREYNM